MAVITEDEAKQLWCPTTPRSFDASGAVHNANCCITTKCMLWNAVEPATDPPSGQCGLDSAAGGAAGGAAGVETGSPNAWTAPQTFDKTLVIPPCTYDELPQGPEAMGLRGTVTDATSNVFNAMMLDGGGQFAVPAYYDNDSGCWRVG